jgi:general secretion pathway protein H
MKTCRGSIIGKGTEERRKNEGKGPSLDSGFTLLELIIVLLLSLLILGLVTVSFPRLFSSAKLQAASRDLATSLKQTRTLAVLRGEKQVWTVNLDTGEYGPEGGKIRIIPPHLSLSVVTPEGEARHNGIVQLVFEPPWGWEAAQFLLSDGKKSITIQLDPLTGAAVTKG